MAQRGRKPKPTHLKLVTGNPGNRPLNKREPKPKRALPRPPGHLSDEALTEWRRVTPELMALGILTACDRSVLASYCQAYGRWVQAEDALAAEAMVRGGPAVLAFTVVTAKGNVIQNPLVGIANKAAADMVRYAAEFGMTPSARSRITTGAAADDEDPAEAYFNKKRSR